MGGPGGQGIVHEDRYRRKGDESSLAACLGNCGLTPPCSVEGARQLALPWLWGDGVEGKEEPQEWGLRGERTVLSEAGSTGWEYLVLVAPIVVEGSPDESAPDQLGVAVLYL